MPSLAGTLSGLGLVSPLKRRLSGVPVRSRCLAECLNQFHRDPAVPAVVILTPTITFVVPTASL